MNDDFNTRLAIEEIFQLVRATNKAMADKTFTRKDASKVLALLEDFDKVLGILPADDAVEDSSFDSVMSVLVDLRKELRARKQYDLADMIRDRLAEAGYKIEDSADGAKWKKI